MFCFSRNGSLDVYISDHLILNYLRLKQTDCNLQITGKDFAVTGYVFGFNKNLKAEAKVSFFLLKTRTLSHPFCFVE